MLFDPDKPSERLLAFVVKLHAGLDRLLNKLTGWSSPRNALMLLVASVAVDLFGEWRLQGTLSVGHVLLGPALWAAMVVPAAIKLDRWLSAGDDGTIPPFVDRYIRAAAIFAVILVVDLVLKAVHVIPSGDTVVIVAAMWEWWLDLALVAVGMSFSPPGRSLFATVADKVAVATAIPARVRSRDGPRTTRPTGEPSPQLT